jgi:hypothetical protein
MKKETSLTCITLMPGETAEIKGYIELPSLTEDEKEMCRNKGISEEELLQEKFKERIKIHDSNIKISILKMEKVEGKIRRKLISNDIFVIIFLVTMILISGIYLLIS